MEKIKSYTEIALETSRRFEMTDITHLVREAVAERGLENGIALVYCPHTTAGITINEGADPDVQSDIGRFLGAIVPQDWGFKHVEGNSDSHTKTAMMGVSESVIVESGRLVLGTWQKIFFCEFDGPRRRRVIVKTICG